MRVPAAALAVAQLALLVLLLPACGGPKAPDAPSAPDADGGELTCAERIRARSICQNALRLQCESRSSDCEAVCTRGDSTQNLTDMAPVYTDERTSGCRENCREARDRCLREMVARCPAPCE